MNSLDKKRYLHRGLLGLLLLYTAGIRYKGIWFGYPLAVHTDEPNIVNAALNIVRTGDLNPHLLDYPSLFIYLQAVLYAIVDVFGKLSPGVSLSGTPDITYYLVGRTFNVVLSTATVYTTYEIGKRLFNAWTGLLAGCFISASTLHTINSFYITVDSSVAFWSSLSILMAVMIARQNAGRRYYVWCGLFAGLTVSSKYTAFAAVIPLIVAHLSRSRKVGCLINADVMLGLAAVPVAFLMTSPFVLLDYQAYFRSMIFVADAYNGGHPGAESISHTSYFAHLQDLFMDSYGALPMLLAVAGIVLLFRKDVPIALLLASFPVILFLFVGSYKVYYPRNLVATIPMLAFFSAYTVHYRFGFNEVPAETLRSARSAKLLSVALIIVAFAGIFSQAWMSVREVRLMTLPDTRWISLQWIEKNMPAGARIGREHYTPPVEDHTKRFQIVYLDRCGLCRTETAAILPSLDYLILSSYDYDRFVRQPDRYPNQAAVYNDFFTSSVLIQEFNPDGETMSGPTIRIYGKRQGREGHRSP